MAQRLFDKSKWIASNVQNLRHESVAPDLPGLCKYAVNNWRIYYLVDHADQLVHIYALVPKEQDSARLAG